MFFYSNFISHVPLILLLLVAGASADAFFFILLLPVVWAITGFFIVFSLCYFLFISWNRFSFYFYAPQVHFHIFNIFLPTFNIAIQDFLGFYQNRWNCEICLWRILILADFFGFHGIFKISQFEKFVTCWFFLQKFCSKLDRLANEEF